MIILGMQKVEPCEWFLSFYANTFTRLFKIAVLDNLFVFMIQFPTFIKVMNLSY